MPTPSPCYHTPAEIERGQLNEYELLPTLSGGTERVATGNCRIHGGELRWGDYEYDDGRWMEDAASSTDNDMEDR